MSQTAVQRNGRTSSGRNGPAWTYRPDVDILNTPESFQIVADVPGANAESISVTFEGDILTIQADVPARRERGAFLRQEFGVGAYHRRFRFDDGVEADGIAADYDSGVLTVTLPKPQSVRPRQVPVRGAASR
jgi:HSP20 family protein